MNRPRLLLLLPLILIGCGSAPDLPSNFALDAKRPEGLAVVSITLAGLPLKRVNGFEFSVRGLPPREEQAIAKRPHFGSAKQHARWVAAGGNDQVAEPHAVVRGANVSEPLDVLDGSTPIGRLVTLRLAPGDYEFYSWKIMERTPYGEMEYTAKHAFSYRFSVEAGKATYLGRLQLHITEQETQSIVVEDQQAGDLDLFRNRYPGVRIDNTAVLRKWPS